MKKGKVGLIAVLSFGLLTLLGAATSVHAAEGEFTLQVSPSPMVLTLKPGETATQELKIRNTGAATEHLRIDSRSFSVAETGEVKLDDTKEPAEVGEWVRFAAKEFTVLPGETFTQKITFAIPESAGFSYSFSLVVTRQGEVPASAQQKLQAKVAIFCLLSIDKPGATRTLELQNLATDQSVYEYLPAKVNVTLKNTGNTIVRPVGNIFIQRGSNDELPLGTLPVNPGDGFILPGSTRTLSAEWSDGFQVVKTTTDPSGTSHSDVEWNWSNLSHFRIGKYTAKVVALYNDGTRDVPVMGEVSFWVIPWKIILGIIAIFTLIGFGIWSVVSQLFGRVNKGKNKRLSVRN